MLITIGLQQAKRNDRDRREIAARKGREQCILTGNGFYRTEDGNTYVAALDGIVSIQETYEDRDIPIEIQMNVTNV